MGNYIVEPMGEMDLLDSADGSVLPVPGGTPTIPDTLPAGRETVASGNLDLTKGHHDLSGASATIPNGTVDKQRHTIKHVRVVPAPINITGQFVDGGTNMASYSIEAYRWLELQWDATLVRWIVKVYDTYTAPSNLLVKDYFFSAKNVVIGASPITLCTIPVDSNATIQTFQFILNPGSYPGVPGSADLVMNTEYLGYSAAPSTLYSNNDMLQLPGQPQTGGSGTIPGTTGGVEAIAITLSGVAGTIDEINLQIQIRAF